MSSEMHAARGPCYSPASYHTQRRRAISVAAPFRSIPTRREIVPEFKPYVPHDSTEREFTLKAALAGIVMAAVFGAANAYLGMKAGQTVAATIPAAVIAIALFRLPYFRGSVLEQNIVRTAASVGEALVAGAIFTIPAFMMVDMDGVKLWTDLRSHYWESIMILLVGGLLGGFYIIGPGLASINAAGGVMAWFILIPLLLFFDPDLAARVGGPQKAGYDVLSYTVWFNIVRPIAVGTMLVGACNTLFSMRSSIMQS